ncbi:hypothetical protein [Aeromicrobium sp. CF3.5]
MRTCGDNVHSGLGSPLDAIATPIAWRGISWPRAWVHRHNY